MMRWGFAVVLPRAEFEPFHRRSDQFQKILVIEVSCRGDDYSLRKEAPGNITQHIFAAGFLHRFHRSIDGKPKGVGLPETLLEQNMYVLVRGILNHADLLEDYVLFAIYFDGIEDRFEEKIGKEIYKEREVGGEDFRVKTDVFLGGKGIGEPPDRIEFLRDIQGASTLCTLEKHMFDEMSDSPLFRVFVARAGVDPDAGGDRVGGGYPFRYHPNPITENRFLVQFPPFVLQTATLRVVRGWLQ